MTNVNVSYGVSDPTHDLSLTDGSTTLGLIFAGGPRILQEVPLTPPAQSFEVEQRNWTGGRLRQRYDDDPTGFFDSWSLWSTSEQKLMPMLQWRFAQNLRNTHSVLPDDNDSLAWWKLYGNDPSNKIARYLSVSLTGAGLTLDKGYLWIRRRGTPGTLTFELCTNNAGNPNTVLQTVTVTTTSVTDTVSVFQLFDWSGTQTLTAATVYHIKIYGASTDDASSHWEVLCDTTVSGKYSTDNSAWTATTNGMFYRLTDADVTRRWFFFLLEGMLYAVSYNADGSGSVLINNGVRGTATAGTTTSLTCSALAMTTNQYTGAFLRIYDGTGDGQIRQIASNTGTVFTPSVAFDIAPDITSRFIVYNTDYWNATTGTPALTRVISRPLVTNGIAYLPQGQSVNMRRMRVNANSHDFADDGTNKADLLMFNIENAAPLVYAANVNSSTIASAAAVTWGSNLTFGTSKTIGSSEYRITNLYPHNKLLHIFKEDGLYTYNNGIIEKLGQNFGDAPDQTTGKGVGSQNNYLWFGWAHSIERMIGSSVDDMLNYKRGYDGMPTDRVGFVSSVASAIGWLFFAIDGGDTSYSSIICWNGMGWHEIYRSWAPGVRIRDLFWQPCPDTRGRLWFSVGGDIASIQFPLYAANPLKDVSTTKRTSLLVHPGINYQHEGVIVTPTYDAHDQNLYKVLALLRVFLESGSVEIDYQTNANVGTSSWTVLGTASTTPVTDINLNLGGVFQVRFRFRLQVTSTRSPTVLGGWQLSGRMMQLKRYQWLATFRADSDATTYTDEPDHSPDTLYSQLQTWATQQTKLTMRSANQSADNKVVTVSLPSKSVDWVDTGENKWGGRISVALLQVT